MQYELAEIGDVHATRIGTDATSVLFSEEPPDSAPNISSWREPNVIDTDVDAESAASIGLYIRLKVLTEWLIASILLVVTSPLVLVLAIIVKTTSQGPAFYAQTRLGLRGRCYRIFKLRTMRHNCEVGTGAVWALREDPRTTKVGQFLRLTHLDELPQLINVLRGEMSLIGPRPERPEIAKQIQRSLPQFHRRLRLRPGVTGLAQMRLPADSTLKGVRHKLAHDLYYIDHVNILLDLRIVVCTILHFIAEALAFACKSLVSSSGRAAEREAAKITFIEDEIDLQAGAA